MLLVHDKRIRAALVIVFLLISGVTIYWLRLIYLSGRHYAAAVAALERYDYDEAGDHLDRGLALRPGDSAILLLAAQTARRRGLIDDALVFLRRAEQSGSDKAAVDIERQLLSVHEGNLSDIAEFMDICEKDPQGPQAANVLEAIIEGSMRSRNQVQAEKAVESWLKNRLGKRDQAQGLVLRGRTSLA